MNYKQVNDYEMLYMINDNDENAYELLFDKYKPIIINLANTFCKQFYNLGLDYEDLYQEGMLGLSYAIKNFDYNSDNTFYTFAILCIKRTMQKIIVSSLRNKNLFLNTSFSLDENLRGEDYCLSDFVFSESDYVDYIFEQLLLQKDILYCKYYLKDKQMPVFELKINGFTNKEISVLLDISYKEVDNCLYNIKKTLKKINILETY